MDTRCQTNTQHSMPTVTYISIRWLRFQLYDSKPFWQGTINTPEYDTKECLEVLTHYCKPTRYTVPSVHQHMIVCLMLHTHLMINQLTMNTNCTSSHYTIRYLKLCTEQYTNPIVYKHIILSLHQHDRASAHDTLNT